MTHSYRFQDKFRMMVKITRTCDMVVYHIIECAVVLLFCE